MIIAWANASECGLLIGNDSIRKMAKLMLMFGIIKITY
jgi:hypothetical protein